MPAVIAAAGPSLDQRLDELRRIRDRALIVCVDTALWPLLTAEIQPDLVVAVDPSARNANHLETIPEGCGVWMVGEGSLCPSAFDAFAGRTFCFRVAESDPWPWLRGVGLHVGLLRTWGSVLTTAFDLTLRMGCNPIVFAGADLAYTGGRPYARETIYELDFAQAASRGETQPNTWKRWTGDRAGISMAGVGGEPVVTASRLVAFRDWIVDTAAGETGRRVVNATGGGILVGGSIEQHSLDEVIPPASPAVRRSMMSEIWRSSRRGSDASAALARAIDALRHDSDSVVLDRWAAKCGERASDLAAALDSASRQLNAGASARTVTMRDAQSCGPRLPESIALLRSFMAAEATPEWLGVGHPGVLARSPDEWLQRAGDALHDAAALTPAALAPSEGTYAKRVFPISAWLVWNRPAMSAWVRVEGCLGHALYAAGIRAASPGQPLAHVRPPAWPDEATTSRVEHVSRDIVLCAALLEWAAVAGACRPSADMTLVHKVLAAAARLARGESLEGTDSVECRVTLEHGNRSISASIRVGAKHLGLPSDELSQPVTLAAGDARWRLILARTLLS